MGILSHRFHLVVLASATCFFVRGTAASEGSPPGVAIAASVPGDPDDIPLPAGVKSVRPLRQDTTVFASPGPGGARRGTLEGDAIVPLMGTSRAPGCSGRWLQIGAEAWVCGDGARLSKDEPISIAMPVPESGLPFSYFFVGPRGSESYGNLHRAAEESPDTSEEAGFGLAIDEVREAYGARWGHTAKGRWVRLADLSAASPSAFEGAHVEGANELLQVAWTTADKTPIWSTEKLTGKPLRSLAAHVRLTVLEAFPERKLLKIRTPDAIGVPAIEGYGHLARNVTRPSVSAVPEGVGAGERWIDVDLASQTLVAYEGPLPVFATLVSTGRGKEGSETLTPRGEHRIWVKLRSTTMANVEDEDAMSHYSLEEVPWVMFFDKAVGIHGAFWHRDFGRVRSHGCVNLAPKDAAWLFAWAGPALPVGFNAVLPSPSELGTMVRVR